MTAIKSMICSQHVKFCKRTPHLKRHLEKVIKKNNDKAQNIPDKLNKISLEIHNSLFT